MIDTTSWRHSIDSQPSIGEVVEITTYPGNRKPLGRIRWDTSNQPTLGLYWRRGKIGRFSEPSPSP